jgi:activator of Hsp90 ATPase-like protein
MTTSVWLQKVSVGTELKVLQEGIPSVIPTEMCYLGWQESLEKLVKLVEPEIPCLTLFSAQRQALNACDLNQL